MRLERQPSCFPIGVDRKEPTKNSTSELAKIFHRPNPNSGLCNHFKSATVKQSTEGITCCYHESRHSPSSPCVDGRDEESELGSHSSSPGRISARYPENKSEKMQWERGQI